MMAINGVQIIDGYDAYELYWGIMALYDDGANVDTIREKYPIRPADYDFDYEIRITAYALAFWEIGAMTDELRQEVRLTIDKGVGVAEWTQECGESEGKARQEELDKLWRKISKPNPKVRKRKTYGKVTLFHFQPHDVLTFQGQDKRYRAMICVKVDQWHGRCHYLFVPTTYHSFKKPIIETLVTQAIIGLRIDAECDPKMVMKHQPDIERVWALYPGLRAPFFIATVQTGISHTALKKFKDKFVKIGALKIGESLLKWNASPRYERTFEALEDEFRNLDEYVWVSSFETFPISAVCDF